MTQDKDVHLLAILQVNDNDECEYTCKAENSAGEKTCSANLHLMDVPFGSQPPSYVLVTKTSIEHMSLSFVDRKTLLHHSFASRANAPSSKVNGLNSTVSSPVNPSQPSVGYTMASRWISSRTRENTRRRSIPMAKSH